MTLTRDPEKLKAWRERSRGLARGEGPKRKTWLRKRNPERCAETFERNFGKLRRAWIVSLGCLIAGHRLHRCEGKLEAAHAIARGAGGAKGNRRHLVCLCTAAHKEAGERPGIGRGPGTKRARFEAKYAIDLIAKAAEIAERADALGYP
jgi:hypothetical protein